MLKALKGFEVGDVILEQEILIQPGDDLYYMEEEDQSDPRDCSIPESDGGEDFEKAFCPTGPGGGIDPTCPSGGAKKDAGGYNPGVVGKLLGIDTSEWKKDTGVAQWAMKKIALLEEAAESGKWSKGKMYPNGGNFTDKYTKAVMQAQDNFNKLHQEHLSKLAPGAKPSAQPEVAAEAGWKKIGEQLGTEKGGLYELDGKKFYVKQPDNVERARNEVLALKLYAAAGAAAKDGHLVEIDGKTALATEWLPNADKVDWNIPQNKLAAHEDFAVHVWLNNRDAVGAGTENPMDNIRLNQNTGKLVMLDAGGSLEYSGMGGSGKKPFSKDPHREWDGFRNKNVNPTTHHVFGSMTAQQLADSTKKLKNVSDQQISDLVQKYGNGGPHEKAEMVAVLQARRDTLVKLGTNIEQTLKPVKPDDDFPNPAIEASKPSVLKEMAKTLISGAAVPPPPNLLTTEIKKKDPFWIGYQAKYDAIHNFAKEGNVAAIEKIKVKPDAKEKFIQKLYAYKVQALASLGAGGSVSVGHVVPKPIPKSEVVKVEAKVDPSKFPGKPTFKDKAYAEANDKIVHEALEHAKKGDLTALKSMALPSSPKLQNFHSSLVSTLSSQLFPPPPPIPISEEYLKNTAAITAQDKAGLKKAAQYLIYGAVPGIKEGMPEGSWNNDNDHLWSVGYKAAKKAGVVELAQNYTGSYSGEYNDVFRKEHPLFATEGVKENAIKLAQGILNHGIEIPEGQMIGRKHKADEDYWKDVVPGTVMSDRGFMSTSTNPETWHGNVHLRLVASKGVKGLPAKSFSKHPHEDEIIVPPNQPFMVTKIERKGSSFTNEGHVTVYGVLLPTSETQCC